MLSSAQRPMSDTADNDPAHFDARGTPAFDSSGVDVTLIDYMLSLSPRERLETLFEHAPFAAKQMRSDGTE